MNSHNPQIAVIGTGYWGKNLVRNYLTLGALRIVCDKNPCAIEQFVKNHPGVRGVLSISDVLSASDIDGVVIATPAETHAQIVRECLLAGKDVYVEKPLCLSTREGHELVQLAQARERILMVGHLLWYHPAVRKLKALISAGELGRIHYIYSNRLNLGKLRREENVLWSFAPHDISLMLGLIDEFPTRVQAQGGNYLHSEIADATVSMLAFPSGVRAHLFVSWLHPFKEQKLVVVGQKKMAVFDDTLSYPEKLKLYAHTVEWPDNVPVARKAEAEKIELDEQEPLRVECEQFLNSIKTRVAPITDGAEGIRVLEVLNACQKALEQGGAVDLTRPSAGLDRNSFVHPSAVVDEGVELGDGSKIWHFSHILAGSKIGRNSNIGQNVVIGPRVTIGDGCKIQNNVSVYDGVTL